MEKVCVNKENCIKCGSCIAIAPKNFDYDEEGYSNVINNEIDENTQNAVNCCPTGAIEIKEVTEN